jgi:hypothetical protein
MIDTMPKWYDKASTAGNIDDLLLPDFNNYVLLQIGYYGTAAAEIEISGRRGMVIQIKRREQRQR